MEREYKTKHHSWDESAVYDAGDNLVCRVEIDGLVTEETQDRFEQEMENRAKKICSALNMYDKMRDMIALLIQCRDALPAISLASAKLHNVPLDLDKRIEACLEPWRIDEPTQ